MHCEHTRVGGIEHAETRAVTARADLHQAGRRVRLNDKEKSAARGGRGGPAWQGRLHAAGAEVVITVAFVLKTTVAGDAIGHTARLKIASWWTVRGDENECM